MKTLSHEEKLNEIHDSAEMFLNMQDELPEGFDREELIAMLVCFADGEITQFDEHNKALRWAADWVENSGAATNDEGIKFFAANMAMTLRAVMTRDESDLPPEGVFQKALAILNQGNRQNTK